jgi:hypothetical protein
MEPGQQQIGGLQGVGLRRQVARYGLESLERPAAIGAPRNVVRQQTIRLVRVGTGKSPQDVAGQDLVYMVVI